MGVLHNPQWEIFARELVELELACVDENMAAQREQLRHRAYQKAGYAGNTDNARRLANHRKVKARVHELFERALEYRDVNVLSVVNRIDRVGRANIRDFYGSDGKPIRNVKDLPRELTEAVESIELSDDGAVVKLKLYDKNQANFTLLKHLGGVPQDNIAANVNILSVLNVDDQRVLAEALKKLPMPDEQTAA